MGKRIDLTGKRFGRLTVIGKSHQNKEKRWFYKCQCDCGNIAFVPKNRLDSGVTRSCGCLQKQRSSEASKTHGLRHTKEYRTWSGMKDRCCNKKSKDYIRYGKRGITICKKWLNNFEDFLEDMGQAPSPSHQIDRIDNCGAYSPENCKWSTPKQNARNKSNSKIWDIKGKVFESAMSAAHYFKVSEMTIWAWCLGLNRTIKKLDCNFTERYPK